MKRGPKLGTVRPTSLVAKLLSLAPDETIIFKDQRLRGKATNMERQVQNILSKSPALTGRRYRTQRMLLTCNDPLSVEAALAVTRI